MASGGGRSPSVPGEAVSLPERILLVPEKLVFDCRSGGRLVLTPSVLMVMQGYRQIGSEDLEAGGVLMGRIENNGWTTVIERLTTPKPQDFRHRFAFHMIDPEHDAELKHVFETTNGEVFCAGHWHTHPEDFPNPGPEDVESWRGTLAESKPGNPCFFAIVGRIEVGVWEGDAATGEIRKMQPR